MPLPRFSRKRSLPVAREPCYKKRRARRHRFSSPFASDEETKAGDEFDTSDYAPFKFKCHPRCLRPSSHCQSDTDNSKKEAVGGKSNQFPACRTAVIFEQQRWEGQIKGERFKKQGRGRPDKQYLVEWKPSWEDGGPAHCAWVATVLEREASVANQINI